MFGIVLWSDSSDSKAVIWCEDHGDLAYYLRPENQPQVHLDAGDLIQFDVSNVNCHRRVQNPRRVVEGVFPDIAGSLQAVSAGQAENRAPRRTARIVPFPGRQEETKVQRFASGS